MQERIAQELALLRKHYPKLEYKEQDMWLRIPGYPLPEGWSRTSTDVACQIPNGYPGTAPYGIYVPVGLTFKRMRPDNYTEPAPTQPPFEGSWGILSWSPQDGHWRAVNGRPKIPFLIV
jgi:hypothetical protein